MLNASISWLKQHIRPALIMLCNISLFCHICFKVKLSLDAIEQQAVLEGESWGPCGCCHGVTTLHLSCNALTMLFQLWNSSHRKFFFWYFEHMMCFLQNNKGYTKCLHLNYVCSISTLEFWEGHIQLLPMQPCVPVLTEQASAAQPRG